MALTTISVLIDENLMNQFDSLCNDFGMTASTVFNVLAEATVRERRIPFNIESFRSEQPTRDSGFAAFLALRDSAKENGIQDWTLDKINAEINAARHEKETTI